MLVVLSSSAIADNYVKPYVRNDGTYVDGHYKSQADRNPYNNYSTQGNSNPYTGQAGSRDPYQVQQEYRQPSYNSGYGNSNNNGRRSGW
jgi:hypothetical protein